MTEADLSIIVVNWNTREMTLDCLRSVYAETHGVSFELIVVDNGSDDGSASAIASEFPNIRLLAEETNHGFACANNIAARKASGRRLLLLNSDTVVLDGAIDALWRFAEKHSHARIWGGRTVFADGSLNIGSAWGRLTGWSAFCYASGLSWLLRRFALFDPEAMRGWDRDTEREVDIVSGCFFLIDTDLWRTLDGFDPRFFMYGEEAELCARAKRAGACPRVTPAATIIHYGGGSATTRFKTTFALFRGKLMLARTHLARSEAAMVVASYRLVAFTRAALFSIRAKFDRHAEGKAVMWRDMWRQRDAWSNQPDP